MFWFTDSTLLLYPRARDIMLLWKGTNLIYKCSSPWLVIKAASTNIKILGRYKYSSHREYSLPLFSWSSLWLYTVYAVSVYDVRCVWWCLSGLCVLFIFLHSFFLPNDISIKLYSSSLVILPHWIWQLNPLVNNLSFQLLHFPYPEGFLLFNNFYIDILYLTIYHSFGFL